MISKPKKMENLNKEGTLDLNFRRTKSEHLLNRNRIRTKSDSNLKNNKYGNCKKRIKKFRINRPKLQVKDLEKKMIQYIKSKKRAWNEIENNLVGSSKNSKLKKAKTNNVREISFATFWTNNDTKFRFPVINDEFHKSRELRQLLRTNHKDEDQNSTSSEIYRGIDRNYKTLLHGFKESQSKLKLRNQPWRKVLKQKGKCSGRRSRSVSKDRS